MTKSNNEWQAKGVEVTCNGRMVATTFGGDLYKHCTDFDAQQAFDHAKLIAAAPELYEALKKVVEWFDAENDHTKTTFHERVEMANAAEKAAKEALAKVRGEL